MTRHPDAYDLDREEADLDRADHHALIDDMAFVRWQVPDECCAVHGRYTPTSLLDGDCPHCRDIDRADQAQRPMPEWRPAPRTVLL